MVDFKRWVDLIYFYGMTINGNQNEKKNSDYRLLTYLLDINKVSRPTKNQEFSSSFWRSWTLGKECGILIPGELIHQEFIFFTH